MQFHPCAAHPDVRLEIDAALPEAAAVSRAERPPAVWEIPDSERKPARCSESPADEDLGRPGATATNGPGTALPRYTGQGSALPPQAAGVTNQHH